MFFKQYCGYNYLLKSSIKCLNMLTPEKYMASRSCFFIDQICPLTVSFMCSVCSHFKLLPSTHASVPPTLLASPFSVFMYFYSYNIVCWCLTLYYLHVLFTCVCGDRSAYVEWHIYGGQKITCKAPFSASIMWNPTSGIQLRLSSLATSALTQMN